MADETTIYDVDRDRGYTLFAQFGDNYGVIKRVVRESDKHYAYLLGFGFEAKIDIDDLVIYRVDTLMPPRRLKKSDLLWDIGVRHMLRTPPTYPAP